MTKAVWISRFRPGLARDEGRRYWRDVHGALSATVGGIKRYTQTHVLDTLPPGGTPAFDGYSFGWFDDVVAFTAVTNSPDWVRVGADAPNLFDLGFFPGHCALVEELVLKDGPSDGIKLAFIVRFRPDVAAQIAAAHWRGPHGSLALKIPGLQRYVQNGVTDPLGPTGIEPDAELDFDGIAELWFPDRTTLDAAARSPEWAACGADGVQVFDMSRLWLAVAEEVVITG